MTLKLLLLAKNLWQECAVAFSGDGNLAFSGAAYRFFMVETDNPAYIVSLLFFKKLVFKSSTYSQKIVSCMKTFPEVCPVYTVKR